MGVLGIDARMVLKWILRKIYCGYRNWIEVAMDGVQ
jgi:hypothetical protein